MENEINKEWYVVNTVTGYEYKVKEKLERRIESMELQDNIFRVIVPEQKVIELKKDRKTGKEIKVEKAKKMFPGYVMVEMIMSDEAWYIIRNTQGVTGFIGSSGKGAKPFPIEPEEVDRVLGVMGISRISENNNFEVGEVVVLKDGPFASMEGKIEFIDMESGQVEIMLDLFGQATKIETTVTSISKK